MFPCIFFLPIKRRKMSHDMKLRKHQLSEKFTADSPSAEGDKSKRPRSCLSFYGSLLCRVTSLLQLLGDWADPETDPVVPGLGCLIAVADWWRTEVWGFRSKSETPFSKPAPSLSKWRHSGLVAVFVLFGGGSCLNPLLLFRSVSSGCFWGWSSLIL